MCDATNPLSVEVCQACGARLRPLRPSPEAPSEAALPLGNEPQTEEAKEEQTTPAASSWLEQLRAATLRKASTPEEAEPAPEALTESQTGESPEWLHALIGEEEMKEAPSADATETAAPSEPPAQEAPTSPPEKLPDWLRDLLSSSPEGKEETTVEEVPPWLRTIIEAEKPPTPPLAGEGLEPSETAAQEAPTEAAITDWLRRLEATEPVKPQQKEPGAPIEGAEEREESLGDVIIGAGPESKEEGPFTFEGMRPGVGEGGEESTPPPEAREFLHEAAVPDWLRETTTGPAPIAEMAEAEQEEEIPDWLRQLISPQEESAPQPAALTEEGPTPPAATESPAAEEGEPALARPEIPDWLRDLAPPEAVSKEEGESELAPAEIPDWLQALRPSEARPPEPEEAPLEEGGVLAGLRGVLPVETIWSEPRRAQAVPVPPGPATDSRAAEVFAGILAGVGGEHPTGQAQPRAVRMRGLTRVLLYLLLAAAILVPLFIGRDWFSQSLEITQPTWDLVDAVNRLPAGSVVLLSFDYDPAMAAELDLQAKAVMRHLLEKRVRILAMSLVPQGPALAQAIWEELSKGKTLVYGQDFLNLGYLAGPEAGLRTLTQGLLQAFSEDFAAQKALSSYPIIQDAHNLSDLAFVFILAGDQAYVRRWIEQVQGAQPVTIMAGVSALAGPSALPYRQSGQLTGLLVGLKGAAEYETATNRPALAVGSLGAQTLAHLVVILAIILGNLAGLAAALRKRG